MSDQEKYIFEIYLKAAERPLPDRLNSLVSAIAALALSPKHAEPRMRRM